MCARNYLSLPCSDSSIDCGSIELLISFTLLAGFKGFAIESESRWNIKASNVLGLKHSFNVRKRIESLPDSGFSNWPLIVLHKVLVTGISAERFSKPFAKTCQYTRLLESDNPLEIQYGKQLFCTLSKKWCINFSHSNFSETPLFFLFRNICRIVKNLLRKLLDAISWNLVTCWNVWQRFTWIFCASFINQFQVSEKSAPLFHIIRFILDKFLHTLHQSIEFVFIGHQRNFSWRCFQIFLAFVFMLGCSRRYRGWNQPGMVTNDVLLYYIIHNKCSWIKQS